MFYGLEWGTSWPGALKRSVGIYMIRIALSQKSSVPALLTFQFSSVAQSCLTLCDPMDCSTPGLLVHHQLPELAQTHVHRVVMPSSHLILCQPLLLLPSTFPRIWSFPMSQFFEPGGQSIGVSASASVLPMNIQDWFPLGWTGCISLQCKGFSRVVSNTTVQKHPFFSAQLSLFANIYFQMLIFGAM